MSLINQMLRDLEQRRTAEAGPSPLGGLSASGTVTQSVNFSVNYVTLAIMVAVIFVGGVIVAYLLGGQQQATASTATFAPEKEASVVAQNVKQSSVTKVVSNGAEINVLPTVVQSLSSVVAERVSKPDVVAVVEAPVAQTLDEEPAAEQAASVTIKPVSENAVGEVSANSEQHINKTIRPLTDEQQSQLAFQRAVKMLGRSNQQGARLALEEALSFAPNHIRARETLAALFLNDGRVSEAAGSLRDGLQLMPGATPLAKLYARILVDQGDTASAVEVLERARPAVSVDPEYHALLAALYRQQEKHAQAAQSYQQILMQRPGVASWWMGLALSQDAMGESAKALDAFTRAQRAGGLSTEVLRYIESRIVVLTPIAPVVTASTNDVSNDADEFGE